MMFWDKMSAHTQINKNAPGTAGGRGGRDPTLALKSRKTLKKSALFRKKIKIT